MRLQDKVCIITGSANGIGLAAAQRFAAEGAIAIVCDLNAEQVGQAVKGKMTEAQFDAVIDVNLKGVFNCAQAVAPTLLAQGSGSIINTSSISGLYGNFGQGNYAASKAAIVGLTKTWARELGPKGVRVNTVVPGPVATHILDTVPRKVLAQIEQACWLKRIGRPEELASDDASYVNGATLEVSGGVSL